MSTVCMPTCLLNALLCCVLKLFVWEDVRVQVK